MYTKAQFTRLDSFEEATHGWFWGSCRDIFGALRGSNSGFEGGGGCTGGGVCGGSGWVPPMVFCGCLSKAPTFLLRCQPMFAESVPFAAHLFTHRVSAMTLIASAHMRELPVLLVAGSSCKHTNLSRNIFRKN